ncbi:hypothetical protein [Luteimonas aquatica]|uniref:hypothetical protein n=1 Tax=Luteimonas aquatica TaxID=450364 RepID=UPI001F5ACE5C|nr:hypothetical protein [Luteimonas aquatica]
MTLQGTRGRVARLVDWIFGVATGFILLGILLFLAHARAPVSDGLVVAGGALLAIGVAISTLPLWRRAWRHPVTATLMAIAHAVALLIANAMARTVLTSATGLPGQDFDWAVAMLTLVLYLPASVGMAAAVLGVLAIFWQVAMFAQLLVQDWTVATWRTFCRFGGVLAGAFFLLGAGQLYERHRSSLNTFALYLAYYGDYQPVTAYPGLPPGSLVVFHENGVISILHAQSPLRITVENIEH